ncbi:MAG TPA: dTMP kinase [Acholeplasmatales bacterium]|nr:dTMP kinase [Acholeplasmatales bacterium]
MSMFITFEGGEGSGKTTVINRLMSELSGLGYPVVKTREPGGSKIAEEIRRIILNVDNVAMDYRTEALLYAASRRQHLTEVILPNLKKENVVLCDRFIDSSLAYQGHARNLGIKAVYDLNMYATEGLLPDLTFFIDVDPAIGLQRIAKAHRDVDRLDLEKGDFHKLVREGYQEVAKMFPDRIVTIDGNQDVETICSQILGIIQKRLNAQ